MANFVSAKHIVPGTVAVYKSSTTGKLYGCWKQSGEFIGMLAGDFDKAKPAAIITVNDPESGETWDFIGNQTHREPEFLL
jgi:hypothetical protein